MRKPVFMAMIIITLSASLGACKKKEEFAVIYNESGVSTHLVLRDRIMETFHKNDWWQAKYAMVINAVKAAVSEDARVFSLLAPTQIEFAEYSESVSDSQRKSIEHINGIFTKDVKKVDVYGALRSRINEYVYFRTDNHWTALGAFYAYEAFCAEAGFRPVPLSDYNEYKADGMLGLFWERIPEAYDIEPDSMSYYVLKDSEFTASRPLVNDGNWYYGMFLDGGYTDYYDVETSVKNGKTAIVVKDSFAHCLVPFLAPHYERLVVLDPRYFQESGKSFSLLEEAEKYGSVDIIFINYALAATFGDYVSMLESIIQN